MDGSTVQQNQSLQPKTEAVAFAENAGVIKFIHGEWSFWSDYAWLNSSKLRELADYLDRRNAVGETPTDLDGSFSYQASTWAAAPAWAQWRFFNPDGHRIYSELEPILGSDCWINPRIDNRGGKFRKLGIEAVPDWKSTKERRPQ